MNWRRIGASLGLVILSNAVVLGGVVFNRTGVPEAAITLTERELPFSYNAFRNDEDTGLSLRLSWKHPNYRWSGLRGEQKRGPRWFDQGKLEAIGYDCSVPLSDPSAELYYDKALPRETYVVLELGGQSWRDLLTRWEQDIVFMTKRMENGEDSQKQLERFKEAYKDLKTKASRLLVIDVENDPNQLRKRYADSNQFLIARALVKLYFLSSYENKSEENHLPYITGEVNQIMIDHINIPLNLREELEKLYFADKQKDGKNNRAWNMLNDSREPRYEVSLKYGKRYEPWITAIRSLKTSPQDHSIRE